MLILLLSPDGILSPQAMRALRKVFLRRHYTSEGKSVVVANGKEMVQ